MKEIILSNFYIAVNAVAPMVVLLIIGAIIRRKNWLNGQELKRLNGVLLKVFFFFMLFNATYHMRPGSFRLHMVGYIIASVFLIICMGWLFAKKMVDNPKSQGALVQALFRSNYGLMGVAIVMNLYPPTESGVAVILTALIVPMNNAIAVALLEHFRGGSMTFKRLFKALFMNSMTLGVACACVLMLLGIKLPAFLDNTSKQLAMMTPHLAIIILGASTMEVGLPNMKYLMYCVVGRLLVIPAIMLSLTYSIGFRGVEFVTLLIMFCGPAATVTYATAQDCESDDVLAGNAVIYSTVFSCITLVGWIFVWKMLGAF